MSYYFNGNPCKHGHITKRFAKTGNCVACTAITSATNGKKNRAVRSEDTRRWRLKNRERYLEVTRQNTHDWCRKNKERLKELSQRPESKAKRCEYTRNREAAKLRATPSWLTASQKKGIATIYEEAQYLSQETGIIHHVDHIEPLRGKNSCGLHVPWNLQVIPWIDNLKKSNKLISL